MTKKQSDNEFVGYVPKGAWHINLGNKIRKHCKEKGFLDIFIDSDEYGIEIYQILKKRLWPFPDKRKLLTSIEEDEWNYYNKLPEGVYDMIKEAMKKQWKKSTFIDNRIYE
jgi:hypothetical protein